MLSVRLGGVRWQLSPLFPALLVVLLSAPAAAPVGRCVAAAFWHESGHILAMALCGARPRAVTLGAFGIRMEQDDACTLSYRQNIAVSAAGPLMNFLGAAAVFLFRCPAIGGVHLGLAVFNLLPLSMLDGGQILYSCLALHISPSRAADVCRCLTVGCLLILYTGAFLVLFSSGYNVSLLVTAVYLTVWLFFGEND